MAKLNITNEEKREFKSTPNGLRKGIWMLVGMLIDVIATLGISFLYMFRDKLPNEMYFLGILFVLLVMVVLGGEMIGVYYGALEQYVYDKNSKKVLDSNE